MKTNATNGASIQTGTNTDQLPADRFALNTGHPLPLLPGEAVLINHLAPMKPLILLLFSFLLFSSCSNNSHELARKFSALPETVEDPWCYYYWVNDDISKEGITKDLLAMKKAGIGTAFLGNVNHTGEDGRVPLFSEEWWECMVHLVNMQSF